MNPTLLRKLLWDLRWPFALVAVLLFAFQVLWARITDRIITDLLPAFALKNVPLDFLIKTVFQGPPGQLMRSLIGGDLVRFDKPLELFSISYVHPFTQTVFAIWAIGRAAGALAGEIDRGTLELLLAQPLARREVVLTHLAVDLILIPALCLCVGAGSLTGATMFDLNGVTWERFPGALAVVAAFLFGVSGLTMAISAAGRSRMRVLGGALGVALVMFVVNLLGQLWDVLEPFRPLTLFYYYQPQPVLLKNAWTVAAGPLGPVNVVAVPLLVGAAGYAAALAIFTRRDLPAPL
jgi:ABC-2 type transport system permease protein